MGASDANDTLLRADEVAARLGVGPITVYRWCREGRLPCFKVGKGWRMRRGALDDFLQRAEQGRTLVSQLNAFLTVPDHVITVATNHALLHRIDAAFFQVSEARGGMLIKCYAGEMESVDALRADLTRHGLDVAALEAAGRFRFSADVDPHTGRVDELRRLLAEPNVAGRSVWVSFDWATGVNLDGALRQQDALGALVDDAQLVVKTAVLEEVVDAWPPADQRRAQRTHRGLIWIAEAGLTFSRMGPLPDVFTIGM